MPKKKDNLFDDVLEQGEKKAQRKAKSAVKKLHTGTKVLAVLFLIIGLAAGVLVCTMMGENDHFTLKGDTALSLDAGSTYLYTEEGVDAVSFGFDCSTKFTVEMSEGITKDANGNYVIPAQEGVYTLTYTLDDFKFSGKLGGETIKRIRVFTVNTSEEDGRNGEE